MNRNQRRKLKKQHSTTFEELSRGLYEVFFMKIAELPIEQQIEKTNELLTSLHLNEINQKWFFQEMATALPKLFATITIVGGESDI